MKVIEDYTQTKHSVISALHYRQIPATFTGLVIYYTLNRKFIYGIRYDNGKLVARLGIPPATAQKQVTGLKINELQPPPTSSCGGETVIYGVTCTLDTYDEVTGDYVYDCEGVPVDVIPDDCEGGPPSDGVPGDTSGGGAETTNNSPPYIPCIYANSLLVNNTYNAKLANLNLAMTQNYESDYTITDYNNGGSYSLVEGNPNEPYVDQNIPYNTHSIIGNMHTHPAGMIDTDPSSPGALSPMALSPTPTPGDFIAPYLLYSGGAMANTAAYTSTIITSAGTFLIQITDESTFANWATINLTGTDPNGVDTQFYQNCANSYYQYSAQGIGSVTAHELALLDNLGSSGMTLSVLNSNNTWTALTSNNGKLQNANNSCNN